MNADPDPQPWWKTRKGKYTNNLVVVAVLQFGGEEQAQAFISNSQLLFQGKPFTGVLMSTLKEEIGRNFLLDSNQ